MSFSPFEGPVTLLAGLTTPSLRSPSFSLLPWKEREKEREEKEKRVRGVCERLEERRKGGIPRYTMCDYLCDGRLLVGAEVSKEEIEIERKRGGGGSFFERVNELWSIDIYSSLNPSLSLSSSPLISLSYCIFSLAFLTCVSSNCRGGVIARHR